MKRAGGEDDTTVEGPVGSPQSSELAGSVVSATSSKVGGGQRRKLLGSCHICKTALWRGEGQTDANLLDFALKGQPLDTLLPRVKDGLEELGKHFKVGTSDLFPLEEGKIVETLCGPCVAHLADVGDEETNWKKAGQTKMEFIGELMYSSKQRSRVKVACPASKKRKTVEVPPPSSSKGKENEEDDDEYSSSGSDSGDSFSEDATPWSNFRMAVAKSYVRQRGKPVNLGIRDDEGEEDVELIDIADASSSEEEEETIDVNSGEEEEEEDDDDDLVILLDTTKKVTVEIKNEDEDNANSTSLGAE